MVKNFQKKTVLHPLKDWSRYISACLFVKTLFGKMPFKNVIIGATKDTSNKVAENIVCMGLWEKRGFKCRPINKSETRSRLNIWIPSLNKSWGGLAKYTTEPY